LTVASEWNRRRSRRLMRFVTFSLCLYVALVGVQLMRARVETLIAFAYNPFSAMADEYLLPAPLSHQLVKWRLRSSKASFRERMRTDPFITLHVVFALRDNDSARSVALARSLADVFLDIGLPVDKRNLVGCTSLQMGVRTRDAVLVGFLLRHGASLDEAGFELARDPACRHSPRVLSDAAERRRQSHPMSGNDSE
jgi:hypothetical protein